MLYTISMEPVITEFHSGDTVKIRGSLYETGIITGFNGTDYRVYFNSTNNMYHEFVNAKYLVLVKCPHND